MALIDLRNIRKQFGPLKVLRGVTLEVREGECLVIIGGSGTGKSVVLKHIVGLLRPDNGEVLFDGQRIDHLPERKLVPVRRQFGFLFQMSALFDSVNVEENIAFPLVEHTRKAPAEIKEIVRQKLSLVGLDGVQHKMPAELSGGQKKRVALARAIALGPRVILYDEPTTGLDPVRSDVINELILKLQRELKVTSIVVTHDMHSAFKIADRIVMLNEGKIIFDGTPQEMQTTEDDIVRRFFTGEAGEEELAGLNQSAKQSGADGSRQSRWKPPSAASRTPATAAANAPQASEPTPASTTPPPTDASPMPPGPSEELSQSPGSSQQSTISSQ